MSIPPRPPRRALTATQATWVYVLFAVVIGGLNWISTAGAQWHSARALFWTDLVLAAAALLAVPFRRRRPLAATTLTVAATAFSAGAVGAWIVCQASLATRRTARPGRARRAGTGAAGGHRAGRRADAHRPGDA